MSFQFQYQHELSLPSEWDHDTDMMNDEELSATSNEEATKVLEQWQADQDVELEIMEVDDVLGSNLLSDDIFGAACASPTGPLEELVLVSIEEDDERFFAPILDELSPSTAPTSTTTTTTGTYLPFDARYAATLKKLQESMLRSQETRKSLTMRTTKTEKYERTSSVCGVISSIESSSRQLQGYLQNL